MYRYYSNENGFWLKTQSINLNKINYVLNYVKAKFENINSCNFDFWKTDNWKKFVVLNSYELYKMFCLSNIEIDIIRKLAEAEMEQ